MTAFVLTCSEALSLEIQVKASLTVLSSSSLKLAATVRPLELAVNPANSEPKKRSSATLNQPTISGALPRLKSLACSGFKSSYCAKPEAKVCPNPT